MKLNLKKINYHKWIPSRFSSFQAKLLIAFLVATLLPLTLVALVSYHVSYNLARDRITNSALMSDEQLIFQLNSRLNQTETLLTPSSIRCTLLNTLPQIRLAPCRH